MFSSPNIIWVIKSRRMRCERNVACMREMRYVYRLLDGILTKDNLIPSDDIKY
jgi:hypothetical protein